MSDQIILYDSDDYYGMYRRIDCRMCQGNLKNVFSLTPTPIANSFPDTPNTVFYYPLDLMECVKCGHIQLKHVLTGLFENYKYESPPQFSPHLEELAKSLSERYPGAQRLLEIGCNNGRFLDAVEKQGFEAVGVDPASNYPGGKIIKEYFSEDLDIGKFDIVVGINVFAHIDDLDSVFKGISKCLNDDGVVIIEVQDFGEMVNKGIFDSIYHEHLDYHTVKPFVRFAKQYGLNVSSEPLNTQGGSMRLTLSKNDECWLDSDVNKDWGEYEDKIKAARASTRLQLKGKVAAWGAPAKATTLIHHFGLQDRISYCVDDAPLKQDRYIPGTAIQIFSSGKLQEDPPDTVLLTAWNYADVFRQKYPHLKAVHPYE